jgi:hypothetical protein
MTHHMTAGLPSQSGRCFDWGDILRGRKYEYDGKVGEKTEPVSGSTLRIPSCV